MSLSNIKPCIKQLKAETRKDFSRGYESKHIWKFSFQHLWPSFWSRISHPLDNVYTLDWNQLSVSYVERYLLLSFNCMSPPIPKTNQMCLFNFEWRNSILSPWRENTLNIQHTHTHTHTRHLYRWKCELHQTETRCSFQKKHSLKLYYIRPIFPKGNASILKNVERGIHSKLLLLECRQII